ncbi:hypothetical protein K493DRAFT_295114 [Basidiobolus meristosporus CBS 931.73]|uniref:Uncharacterized protein n=1 Tax=Basidiobolus meristosporus CBS 931.73 TaxID=1314790 RepID=A0A1Y1ZDF9_9FUNG|nr:hypothetical protein K493DRAFT_295114 [Basidiobolus meristosporus CBS 931.73]|eukprot:ORY08322.1 hypothetical protein K493DRAFT_295114 [Basidiobolus meristosporus CBS 931.73]
MTPCSSRGGSPSPSTKDSLSVSSIRVNYMLRHTSHPHLLKEISEETDSELSEASLNGSASSDDSDAEKVSVTDGSDPSDDENVKSLKRLHRDGTKRLVELSEEFEALKSRLMESKIEDLDNEKKEILDGVHPEYREQQDQLEERLRKRRKMADIRKQYRSFDIQNQFDGTKKQATDTLVAERAVLRQAFMDMIQRKKRLLQKEFDALEEQSLENLEAQQDLSVMRISSLLNTQNETSVDYTQQERSFVNYVKSLNSGY